MCVCSVAKSYKPFVTPWTVARQAPLSIGFPRHSVICGLIMPISGGLPGGSDGKEYTCKAGDPGLIPESGRSPGEGNGYPLQYSCLKNSTDREAWMAIILGVTKNRTRLSN